MAINRFAIMCDGFGKPDAIGGNNWAQKNARAVLITDGYSVLDLLAALAAGLNKLGFSFRIVLTSA